MSETDLVVRAALPEEMDEIYRLRYRTFCEELKFLDPAAHAAGREFDAYDSTAYHIVVMRSDRIIGYTRLLLPREDLPFLIEQSVALPPLFERNAAMEVSRGLVVPEERRCGVKELLVDAVFDFGRRHGYRFLLSFSNKVMFESWKKRGVTFWHVGAPVEHGGYLTWPLIIAIT